ncbi:MAG: pitrilysin family protein, partial [Planctomycetota bacterium]
MTNFHSSARKVVALLSMVATIAAVSFVAGPEMDSCAYAQTPQQVTEVEGITEYRLDNGVKLLLFPDKSKPQFTINVTVRAGSRHEGYGETGMAHLLEHMLFKGTDRHPDIPALLKDRGVLNMNGTTWVDRTNYYETLPSTGDNLEFAIDMEADRLINSWINGEDLESEMTVVRNEFERGENSPSRILYQRIMAGAYEWHNYGKSTIGNRTDIERVQIPNLRAFYRKFYQPDNIMVVIAGDFETENALELVQQYFGAIPRPERELPTTYTEEPVQDGERVVKLRRVGDYQVVGVAYHIPAAGDEMYPSFEVMAEILGNQPDGPLYKNLVEAELASSISADAMATHDPGMIMATADVNIEDDIEAARRVLVETVESIATDGVSDEDVSRAITKLANRRERAFANTEQFAINLSEWEAYGDWRLFFLHRDRVGEVTADDVQLAAQSFLLEDNRTVGMFLPQEEPVRAPLPSRPDLETALAGYTGGEAISTGEAFEPTPANIDARTITGQLDSGAQYAFLPKETRGDKVFVSIDMHYGDEETLFEYVTASEMLPRLLSRGTESYSFQEFRDRLNELSARMSFSGGTGDLSVSIETTRENLN